jgi:P27 family predicted phage terminase small subunit
VPRRLNTDGRRAWRSIWSGAKSWLSPELDPIAVESLAYDYQRLCDLRDKISSGDIPQWTSNEAGRLFAHPAIAQVASLEARVMAWSAQLGLSPSDRARLGLSQVRVRDADDEVSERSKAREIEREVQRRLYLISMEHQAE